MSIVIRALKPSDRREWQQLWADYLIFYRQNIAPEVSDFTWSMMLDENGPYWALVAETDGGLLGFAHHQTMRSTWSTKPSVYLEDLYVAEPARGQGIGRQLIESGMLQSSERGAGKYFWQTDQENATAQRLYDSLAGGPNDRITYAVDL